MNGRIGEAFSRGPRAPIPGSNDLYADFERTAAKAASAGLGRELVTDQLGEAAKLKTSGVRGARLARRTRRLRSKIARTEQTAALSPPPLVLPEGRAFFDPLVSYLWSYLLSFGLTVTVLEATGTYTTLAVFDSSLGRFRLLLSIASGAILALGGHACGHVLFSASRATRAKKTLAVVAIAIATTAVGAICWTGINRSGNEAARGAESNAAQLISQAGEDEEEAREAEAPRISGAETSEAPTHAQRARAADLRRDARGLTHRAEAEESKGIGERSLDFLAGIQLLGFAVGVAGGWLFAEATPVRAAKVHGRWQKLLARFVAIDADETESARVAYAHFLAELAIAGIDLGEIGSPVFSEVDPRGWNRSAVTRTNGNGGIS